MVKIATVVSFLFLALPMLVREEKSPRVVLDSNKKYELHLALEKTQDSEILLMDSVLKYICLSKIVHKDIVMKQVIWETGWLKGEFLMSRNNLFGFRYKEYLRFSTWKESVDYYESWQAKYYTNPEEDYYQFLVRMRYSNSRYPGHLKSIKYSKTCTDLQ
ncbi:MAG: hypothetical protein FJX80_08265 [Bacteroidetes bacterium]|nr:hypothetical protein [Bacteroidota bacterium]